MCNQFLRCQGTESRCSCYGWCGGYAVVAAGDIGYITFTCAVTGMRLHDQCYGHCVTRGGDQASQLYNQWACTCNRRINAEFCVKKLRKKCRWEPLNALLLCAKLCWLVFPEAPKSEDSVPPLTGTERLFCRVPCVSKGGLNMKLLPWQSVIDTLLIPRLYICFCFGVTAVLLKSRIIIHDG